MPNLINKIIELENEIKRRQSMVVRKRIKMGITGFIALGLISCLGYFGMKNNYSSRKDIIETAAVKEIPQLNAPINNINSVLEAKLKNVNSYLVLLKGRYTIPYDIVIDQKGTLEIEPGTEIYFGKDGGILAYGTLKAIGTEQERIAFTAHTKLVGWKNITFVERFSNNSILKYCTISYGSGRTVIPRRGEFQEVSLTNSKIIFGYDTGGLVGGGILFYYSHVTIENCFVEHNKARMGGGICLAGSDAILKNNVITDNYAEFIGGGISLHHSNPKLTSTIIKNNTAKTSGGGLDLIYSNPILEGNTIANNVAEGYCGGGASLIYSNPLFKNNTIVNNIARENGGGLHLGASDPVLNENIIKENKPDDVHR